MEPKPMITSHEELAEDIKLKAKKEMLRAFVDLHVQGVMEFEDNQILERLNGQYSYGGSEEERQQESQQQQGSFFQQISGYESITHLRASYSHYYALSTHKYFQERLSEKR